MLVRFDERKRCANLRKHGIDFVGVEEVFEGLTVTVEDTRMDYGEQRFVTMGLLRGRAVVVVHTEQDDVIRVISIRKAKRNEEKAYFEQIAD